MEWNTASKNQPPHINNLIAETERALRLLDTSIQNTYRFLATKKLKQIISTPSFTNVLHKRQAYVLKAINQMLNAENAIITPSDKGKTTVIMYMKDYSNKVQSFITDNNINTLKKDPTNK